MDAQKKTIIKGTIVAGILLVLWYVLKIGGRNPEVITSNTPGLNPFQAPFFTTNPGIPDNWSINTGGQPFNSSVNVSVNTGTINGLANQYMPMFGLVGMTAVSG